jgi:sodium transport system permease protein
MNWKAIRTVYLKELKDSLRDRRTLLSMIFVPALIMPAIIFGFGAISMKMIKKAGQERASVMIIGGADSPTVRAVLETNPKLRVQPASDDYATRIAGKQTRAAVEISPGFETALANGEKAVIKIYHHQGDIRSTAAVGEIDRSLREYREKLVQQTLVKNHLPPSAVRPFDLARENVAPPEKVGGSLIGGFVPYALILLSFVGALYPAMDLTAGEKERGTMETILCSPLARIDLVLGKFLMVLTASLSTVICSLTSLGLSMTIGGSYLLKKAGAGDAGRAISDAQALSLSIDPRGVLAVFVMVLPLAVLFAAVLFTVSLFAKSYKEAQTYTSPMIVLVILPSIAALLPGVELNPMLSLVPILNVALVSKEMVSGTFPLTPIILIFLSTCAYAAVALTAAVRMFNREDVLFRT